MKRSRCDEARGNEEHSQAGRRKKIKGAPHRETRQTESTHAGDNAAAQRASRSL